MDRASSAKAHHHVMVISQEQSNSDRPFYRCTDGIPNSSPGTTPIERELLWVKWAFRMILLVLRVVVFKLYLGRRASKSKFLVLAPWPKLCEQLF
jgi:hypothetical protein